MPQLPIAVLISGGGTTLKNLIDKSRSGELRADIRLVVSSNHSAKGIRFAQEGKIPVEIVEHDAHSDTGSFSQAVFETIRRAGCQLVVMGGFLKRIEVPDDFRDRVINIHPSLIPAFCGKGYYGLRVHRAVLEFGCKVTGCTVHFVDDEYDHGPIIAQRAVDVHPDDDPESLSDRVFGVECELYPAVINSLADQWGWKEPPGLNRGGSAVAEGDASGAVDG